MASTILSAKVVRLREVDGVICADTLDIARNFRRRHDNVLQGVDQIVEAIKSTPLNIRALGWFRLAEYYDPKQEKRRRYDMTEEGFALVVGRYTGKDALEWQIAYHNEFQRMKGLLGRAGAPAAYALFEPIVEPEHRENVVAFQGPPRPQGEMFPSEIDGAVPVTIRATEEPSTRWTHHCGATPWYVLRRNNAFGEATMLCISGDRNKPTQRFMTLPSPRATHDKRAVELCLSDPPPPCEVIVAVYGTLGPGPDAPVAIATLRHWLAQ